MRALYNMLCIPDSKLNSVFLLHSPPPKTTPLRNTNKHFCLLTTLRWDTRMKLFQIWEIFAGIKIFHKQLNVK